MGTDALRFTLITSGTPGNDLNLSLERVEANRNFANKLWNAGRFVIGNLDAISPAEGRAAPTLSDRWILARLSQVIAGTTRLMDSNQYGEAGRLVHEFFWNEYADWYIELSKLQMAEGGAHARRTARILVRVLDTCLRMLHPFTPFVTEELWGHLKEACLQLGADFADAATCPEALIIASWPKPEVITDDESIQQFGLFMEVVRTIRNLRAEKKVPLGQKTSAVFVAGGSTRMLENLSAGLCALARLDPASVQFTETPPTNTGGMVPLVAGPVKIFIPLADIADMDAERERLGKELANADKQIERLEALLASEFGSKAPAPVVEKERKRLEDLREMRSKIQDQLKAVAP